MKFSHRSVPAALLILCIGGYGLYILLMGFYWDDWPWVWFSHVIGSQGMLKIDLEHRPLSGIILWIGSLLAGESTIRWQIYNLVFRWFTGVSLFWMLVKLWPNRKKFAATVSLFMIVYSGFSQQFVAVNNSRHLFPLALFFISTGWMIVANRDRTHYWRDTVLAVTLSLLGMLMSDYYYGLELIRPVILWYMNTSESFTGRLRAFIREWLPYLIPLTGIFIWRTWVAQAYFYRVSILDDLATSDPSLFNKIIDPIRITIASWINILHFPDSATFGPRMLILYFSAIILGIFASFFYLLWFKTDQTERRWFLIPLAFGILAVTLAFIPFWATGLEVKLEFPNDRLTLPMMMGTSLILVSLIYLLVRNRFLRAALLAAFIGLSLGHQLKNANDYRRDWNYQVAFFEQFTWRIPGIEPSTAILTNEFPNRFSTDNSLTAPLNWIYAPEFQGGDMPVMMFYTSRFDDQHSVLTPETPLHWDYRFFAFNGNMGDSIVLYHAPPACLRVLDPEIDQQYPFLPEEVKNYLQFSNLERISLLAPPAKPPAHIMGVPKTGTWCYYYEQADLARQLGNWEQVSQFGDMAFALDDSPNHASERVPFIEGYAHVGRWDEALELSREAIQINKFMGPMLCDTWSRIDRSAPNSLEKDEILSAVRSELNCDQ